MGLLSQALVLLLATPIFSNPISPPLEARQADVYDYIVVGSGPGGGPLASNLARQNFTVLLIEAGDTSTQGSSGQYPPQITWDFFVKHYSDEKRTMMNNHLTWKTSNGAYWVGKGTDQPPAGSTFLGVYYPRGSTVGGSSMINAMVTWLPPDSDWNYIANLTGDASWSADKMRKIFERIEKNNYLTRGTAGHGFDGYFETNLNKVSRLDQPVSGIVQAICSNFSADYSTATTLMSRDPNFLDPQRDFTTGLYGLATHTKANGQRYSSRDYVTDTINKKFPLTLSQNSLATRVLFDTSASACGGKPRATGIEYLQGKSIYRADARYKEGNTGTKKTATARNEVILSGGAFNTPQLLMLSGIGPKDDLTKFDIPVLVNSPGVGKNMQDNQEMPIIGKVSGNQAGGFSQPILMMKTGHSLDGERDMFVMQGPGFAFRGFWPSNQTNRGCCTEQSNIYGISMVKNHPQNKAGYVKLKSKDPQDTPEINFMHFEEGKETDMGAMKDTIAWARNIYAKASGVSISTLEPPCPSGQVNSAGFCSDAKIDEDWITGQTFGHHPGCTAAIGKDGDPNAVLDSRFRVRGVAGLRVVDASVWPRLPGVFPVVSTFMTSEKASDVLIEDAKKPVCQK